MLFREISAEFFAGMFVLRRFHKLNSNSQYQEVVIHYIFKESVNLQSFVYKCISLRK